MLNMGEGWAGRGVKVIDCRVLKYRTQSYTHGEYGIVKEDHGDKVKVQLANKNKDPVPYWFLKEELQLGKKYAQ